MVKVYQSNSTVQYSECFYLGMPAWNQGAVLSSPSSGLRLSVLSGGRGGGGGVPDTELLELLI